MAASAKGSAKLASAGAAPCVGRAASGTWSGPLASPAAAAAAGAGSLCAAAATPATTSRTRPGRLAPRWAVTAGTAVLVVATLATTLALVAPAHGAPAMLRGGPSSSGNNGGGGVSTSGARERSAVSAAAQPTEFKPPHGWHRSNILLIGDSITEMGTSTPGGWATLMAQAYSRRADVINRGFGGYTTALIREVLPEIIETAVTPRTALALIWLGANDAVTPDGPQAFMRVSVEDYAANLKAIIAALKGAGVANIGVLTPPPVDDAKRTAYGPPGAPPDRKLALTGAYAAAAAAAGRDAGAAVLDVYTELQARAPGGGWSGRWLLGDGLHLSTEGNAAVFQLVNDFIWAKLPAARTDALPYHHPTWEEVDYGDLKPQFDRERAAAAAAA